MNVLMSLILWSILLVLCWPLAIVVLALWPIVWLLSLPFKLFGIILSGVLAALVFLLWLPFKVMSGSYSSNKARMA